MNREHLKLTILNEHAARRWVLKLEVGLGHGGKARSNKSGLEAHPDNDAK
jgi:hypothetical protein